MIVLHIHAAYGLTVINRHARAVKYQGPRDYQVANFASRTMRWTGIIVALFLIWHLADLTWGCGQRGRHRRRRSSVARCTTTSCAASSGSGWRRSTSSPTSPSASTCSTARGACSSRIGWNNPRFNSWRRGLAVGIATFVIVVGNVLVPDRRARRHRRHLRLKGHVRDARLQESPTARWPTSGTTYKEDAKLVNPANKRKYKILVVGSGLAGAAAAATLAELGYQVDVFTFHDSPRRAHSIAAQGGINAAKNYHDDGDSVHRLFYDTVKGGDFRARESNVHRLAEVSVNIIDQMVAQGVPFAREYGGLLDNRSFGGAQVSRTFYARGQTGQQLLLGAYQQLARQIGLGNVRLFNRVELVDVVARRRQVRRHRHPRPAQRRDRLARRARHRAVHRRLRQRLLPVDQRDELQRHRGVAGAPRGAYFANPCYTQIHPTCIPQSDDTQSKLTLMSESLRNDGRVWVPKVAGDERPAAQIPEDERDYYLERLYPSFGNLAPRDISSRAAKRAVDSGRGVGPLKNGVYLDFAEAIGRLGQDVVQERYGNLFEMYERITGEDPYDDADAHLPGQPLHDGRAVGRLRADDHDPRPVLRR